MAASKLKHNALDVSFKKGCKQEASSSLDILASLKQQAVRLGIFEGSCWAIRGGPTMWLLKYSFFAHSSVAAHLVPDAYL